MPRQLWIVEACRDWGLTTREVDGWRTRGSESFNPIGTIAHHTGGPSTGELPELPTLINGRSDLPGPLCNVGLGRSGTCYVVAAGRANHGGAGNWKGATGNSAFLGIEPANDGRQGWPEVQIEAYVRLCAALQDGMGRRDASWVCGHKEYATPPGRKPDPHSIDMHAFRARVAAILSQGDDMTPEQDQLLRLIANAFGVSPANPNSDMRGWVADLHREVVSGAPQPVAQDGIGKIIRGIRDGAIVVKANANVNIDPAAIADQIVQKLGPQLAQSVANAVITRTAQQYAK